MVREAFSGLLGQATAVNLLSRAIAEQRVAPAYLFLGPAGVGRRFAARQFAQCLLATPGQDATVLQRRIEAQNHPDLMWVEPTYLHKGRPVTVAEAEALELKRRSPPQIRLEQIRDVTRFLGRPTLESPRAVVVIEGAETMAEAAANGLLKTLEEPGSATLILLAVAGARLLPTIISRCQNIPFRRLSETDMTTVLTAAGHQELQQQPDLLAMAQGSPGQAIAAWQQLQAIPPDLLAVLQQMPRTLREALDLARRISRELDIESQLWLVEYLQQQVWQSGRSPALLAVLEQTQRHLRRFVQPRLAWEVALMQFWQAQ